MTLPFRLTIVLAGVWLMALAADAHELDWPQFRGPQRLATSPETGLLKSWPTSGPTLLWQAKDLGTGYSSVSIANGRIFSMSYRGEVEGVWCLDEATGKEKWFTPIGKAPRSVSGQEIGYNDGPRCTPTVDGENVYALGTGGELVCLSVDKGQVKWRKNLEKDFGGKMMSIWGYSESVLIDGDKLVCTPGGDEAAMVAVDKTDGRLLWKARVPGAGGAGYGSITPIEVAGKRIYMNWLKTGLVGIDAQSGKLLWRYAKAANNVANISTPVVKDQFVFCSTAYKAGSALLELKATNEGGVKAEQVYFIEWQKYQNHHGGTVLVGDHLYGGHGQNDGRLTCIEFKTGKIKWQERGIGKGSCAILYADGMLYCRFQDGTMALVEANPVKMEVRGKFQLPYDGGKPSWPHPVISKGRLYIREQEVLMCFDIKS